MNIFNRDLVIGEVVYFRGNAVRVLGGPGMSTSQIMSDDLQIEYVNPEDGEIETIDAMAITETDQQYFDDMARSFAILSVARGDLDTIGYDFSKVSDGHMLDIADEISDNEALMNVFWIALDAAAENLGIPKYKKVN